MLREGQEHGDGAVRCQRASAAVRCAEPAGHARQFDGVPDVPAAAAAASAGSAAASRVSAPDRILHTLRIRIKGI